MEQYFFDESNQFVISDYHKAKPFSSFLPGIAGKAGIPIWAFYVNRGQGISGFGIRDKDHSMMEFLPANKAYQSIQTHGFRTFIKVLQGDKEVVVEPFINTSDDNERKFCITKDSFHIYEYIKEVDISIKVSYTTLVNIPFGGLIRRVELTNHEKFSRDIEIIDGLPALLPYGVSNTDYKEMSNLIRSWMEVKYIDTTIPFYKLRSSTEDEAVVKTSEKGFFFLHSGIQDKKFKTIYDPGVVFDYHYDLQLPVGFINNTYEELINKKQAYANKVPSSFVLGTMKLEPQKPGYIDSIYGYSDDYKTIATYAKQLSLDKFVNNQFAEAKKLVNEMCSQVYTQTNYKIFDEYIRQSYLDNVMRGGLPLIFDNEKNSIVYHIYSRKHGDQERDYNFYSLEPSYYSQGNGNFRDVNQNRRNDLCFEPRVFDYNLWTFFSLIQTDGYNPLSVNGSTFLIEKTDVPSLIGKLKEVGLYDKVALSEEDLYKYLNSSFTPGKIINALIPQEKKKNTIESILKIILSYAKQEIEADFGEGYWSDHFTYNLDLIEDFAAMYPDKLLSVVFEGFKYGYYNSPYGVVPQNQRYSLLADGTVRQYKTLLKKKRYLGKWMTNAEGEKVETNLFNKLLTLALTKFMNLDSFGMGIEMEGDKPGWNDALNGLPGLMASGMSETIELNRILTFMSEILLSFSYKRDGSYSSVLVLEETKNLLTDVLQAISEDNYVLKQNKMETAMDFDAQNSYQRWYRLNQIKDAYRKSTEVYLSSIHLQFDAVVLMDIINKMVQITNEGIQYGIEIGKGIMPSYFVMEVVRYEKLSGISNYGQEAVLPLEFSYRPLPYFLEAPARYLKIAQSDQAKELIKQVKTSGMYDKELKMYKTSESLEMEGMEIGRIRAFTPGWLERESIFSHMNYKYLLGMLKSGCYESFYQEIRTNLVPFMDPHIYKRPITENSSFIASSMNPDEEVVGQGFVARLSGATAEILNMWKLMMVGETWFTYEDNVLRFTFAPILPGDFFDEDGKVSFKLFGHTLVTYINASRKNTFGIDKAKVANIFIEGKYIHKDFLEGVLAEKLRNREIDKIIIEMN